MIVGPHLGSVVEASAVFDNGLFPIDRRFLLGTV